MDYDVHLLTPFPITECLVFIENNLMIFMNGEGAEHVIRVVSELQVELQDKHFMFGAVRRLLTE